MEEDEKEEKNLNLMMKKMRKKKIKLRVIWGRRHKKKNVYCRKKKMKNLKNLNWGRKTNRKS